VLALPEMDRTCEDQQDELEDLEARIAGLKAALSELGRPTSQAEHDHGDGDQRHMSADCMEALDLALAQGS